MTRKAIYSARLNIPVPESIRHAVDAMAAKQGRTVSEVARELLRAALIRTAIKGGTRNV